MLGLTRVRDMDGVGRSGELVFLMPHDVPTIDELIESVRVADERYELIKRLSVLLEHLVRDNESRSQSGGSPIDGSYHLGRHPFHYRLWPWMKRRITDEMVRLGKSAGLPFAIDRKHDPVRVEREVLRQTDQCGQQLLAAKRAVLERVRVLVPDSRLARRDFPTSFEGIRRLYGSLLTENGAEVLGRARRAEQRLRSSATSGVAVSPGRQPPGIIIRVPLAKAVASHARDVEPTRSDGAVPRRALITGISGQDGFYLAWHLLDRGYEVHGVARRPLSLHAEVDPELDAHPRFVFHYGDVTDLVGLVALMHALRPNEVYNLAAQSHVGYSFAHQNYTRSATYIGCLNVLESVHRCGLADFTKVYQASSSEMFGLAPAPQRETSPFRPCSPYGLAKSWAHERVLWYRRECGMYAVGGILFNHESERRGKDFVTQTIAEGVALIKAGLLDELRLGDLHPVRDWGYAPEYVTCMYRMLQRSEAEDLVIATGRGWTVRQFCDAAFAHVGLDASDYLGHSGSVTRRSEIPILVGDATKAKEVLGWEPKMHVEGIVQIMVDAAMARLAHRLENGDPERPSRRFPSSSFESVSEHDEAVARVSRQLLDGDPVFIGSVDARVGRFVDAVRSGSGAPDRLEKLAGILTAQSMCALSDVVAERLSGDELDRLGMGRYLAKRVDGDKMPLKVFAEGVAVHLLRERASRAARSTDSPRLREVYDVGCAYLDQLLSATGRRLAGVADHITTHGPVDEGYYVGYQQPLPTPRSRDDVVPYCLM